MFSQKGKTVLLENDSALISQSDGKMTSKIESRQSTYTIAPQGMINVSVSKLDDLTDLVEEMVISEAMVTQKFRS